MFADSISAMGWRGCSSLREFIVRGNSPRQVIAASSTVGVSIHRNVRDPSTPGLAVAPPNIYTCTVVVISGPWISLESEDDRKWRLRP